MSHRPRRATTVSVTLWLLTALGCGGPALPPLGLVEGTVTIGGKPEAGIGVLFIPGRRGEGPNPSSAAVTDADGRYRLEYTIPNDRDLANPTIGEGAVLGSHTVTVSDYKMKSEMLPPPGRVPAQYGDPSTTPLRCEVKEGEQTYDITL